MRCRCSSTRIGWSKSTTDYGEPRYRVLGQIEERLFLVVYTPRGDAFRMISARKANAKEVARYGHSSRDA